MHMLLSFVFWPTDAYVAVFCVFGQLNICCCVLCVFGLLMHMLLCFVCLAYRCTFFCGLCFGLLTFLHIKTYHSRFGDDETNSLQCQT